MQKTLKSGLILIAAVVAPGAGGADFERENAFRSFAQEEAEQQDLPLAIGGYDPTLYFAGGLPKPGNASIRHAFEGQVYYFASYESRQTFIDNPTRYAPQYAGHCAFAMSEHRTAQANPTVFAVQDDKLFLFENEMKLEMWKNNSRKFRILADKRWEFEAKNFSRFRAKF